MGRGPAEHECCGDQQARDEAQRIEAMLARLLETRGFKTLLNWIPLDEQGNPGEVDLVAVLDRHLLVFEVKSTYLRRSQKDAWRHATGALRTAGRQLQRKIEAVSRALATDPEFRVRLGLTDDRMPTHCLGWIADTSIECID
jgi:Holliday junction resolvase-like predicted endonuclease